VMEYLGLVKPTLRNLGVYKGQALSLDQHVNSLVHTVFIS